MVSCFEGKDGVCPHCGKVVNFKDSEQKGPDNKKIDFRIDAKEIIASGKNVCLYLARSLCPSCHNPIITLAEGTFQDGKYTKHSIVYPVFSSRYVSPEVPPDIAEDFKEASKVISISKKASAALSRRCLQNVLVNKGAKKRDLADQIDEMTPNLPSPLNDNLHAVRVVGNFAAHPIKNKQTNTIVDVEPEEAEFLLDLLEQLFDFYYVQPVKAKDLKEKINTKLKASGKPTI